MAKNFGNVPSSIHPNPNFSRADISDNSDNTDREAAHPSFYSPETLQSWIELLDFGHRGIVRESDVTDALFACGLEPKYAR